MGNSPDIFRPVAGHLDLYQSEYSWKYSDWYQKKNHTFFVVASFCENQRSSDPAFESRWPCGHFASRNSRIGRGIAEISPGEFLCYSAQSKEPLQFLQTPSQKSTKFLQFVTTGRIRFPASKLDSLVYSLFTLLFTYCLLKTALQMSHEMLQLERCVYNAMR